MVPMEEFGSGGSMHYPEVPPDPWQDDEWFGVEGDLDDFIFYYEEAPVPSEEMQSFRPSQR